MGDFDKSVDLTGAERIPLTNENAGPLVQGLWVLVREALAEHGEVKPFRNTSLSVGVGAYGVSLIAYPHKRWTGGLIVEVVMPLERGVRERPDAELEYAERPAPLRFNRRMPKGRNERHEYVEAFRVWLDAQGLFDADVSCGLVTP